MIFRQNKKRPALKFYAGGLFWLALLALVFFDYPKILFKNAAVKTVLFLAPEAESLKISRENLVLISRISDLEKENNTLKQALALKPERAVPAKVIFGGGFLFMDAVFINAGAENGVSVGDLVALKNGVLAGKISEVSDSWSKMLVFGRLGEETRLRLGAGSAVSARGIGGGEFVAEFPAETSVEVGGQARLAEAPDYTVGLVDKILAEEGGRLKKVFIKAPFSPSALYDVKIILQNG